MKEDIRHHVGSSARPLCTADLHENFSVGDMQRIDALVEPTGGVSEDPVVFKSDAATHGILVLVENCDVPLFEKWFLAVK
jgi:hypothetical protein